MNATLTPIESGAVRVTGSDRLDFVHGQVSSDVKGLPTPGGSRSLVLNVRGQIEFDLRLYRRADDLYLQTDGGMGGALVERLRRYIVFDDVKLEDLSGKLRVLHLAGPDAGGIGAALGFDPAGRPVQALERGSGTVLVSSVNRGAGPGYDLHVLSDRAGELEAGLAVAGVAGLAPADLERRRVLAGLPNAHADGFLGLLPQECGLEEAVSYRKGCYIGQEIMARLEARGSTRQHVARVRADSPLESGAELDLGGRAVGRVGRPVVADGIWTALAVVRKDVPDGATLEMGTTMARLSLLPSG